MIQVGQEDPLMSDQYLLSEAQLERIKPYFPLSHGRPRVDDRRMISGDRSRHSQWLEMEACASGLWAIQDTMQPLQRVGHG
jgi:hypothetical protein